MEREKLGAGLRAAMGKRQDPGEDILRLATLADALFCTAEEQESHHSCHYAWLRDRFTPWAGVVKDVLFSWWLEI